MFVRYFNINETALASPKSKWIAYNPSKSLLAVVLKDANFEIIFYHLEGYSSPNDATKADPPPFSLNFCHKEKTGSLISLFFTPDDRLLVVSTAEKIILWQVIGPDSSSFGKTGMAIENIGSNSNHATVRPSLKYEGEILITGEPTCVAVSPDSCNIAIGTAKGIIFIKKLKARDDSSTSFDIKGKVCCVLWDPKGMLIGALNSQNDFSVWDVRALRQISMTSLNLNIDARFVVSNRETRVIDWSPDGKNILVTSLDDRKLHVACVLERARNFDVGGIIGGPFTTITCCKFNPKLFEKPKDCLNSVYALGDAYGNISVWMLPETKSKEKPIVFIKSDNTSLSIEDISWHDDGHLLMATTTQKFIILVKFDFGYFSEQVHDPKKKNLQHFSVGVGVLNKTYRDLISNEAKPESSKESKEAVTQEKKKDTSSGSGSQMIIESSSNQEAPKILPIGPKVIMLKATGGGNEGPKVVSIAKGNPVQEETNEGSTEMKKLQIKRKDESGAQQPEKSSSPQSQSQKPGFSDSNPKSIQMMVEMKKNNLKKNKSTKKLEAEKVNQHMRHDDITKYFSNAFGYPAELSVKLDKKSIDFVVFEKDTRVYTRMTCCVLGETGKEQLWETIVNGQFKFVESNQAYILVYCDNSLLNIIYASGKRVDTPLMIPNLVLIRLNEANQVLMIKKNGDLSIYNILTREQALEDNIAKHIKDYYQNFIKKNNTGESTEGSIRIDSSEEETKIIKSVGFNSDIGPCLHLFPANTMYLDTRTRMWHFLDSLQPIMTSNEEKSSLESQGLLEEAKTQLGEVGLPYKIEKFFERIAIEERGGSGEVVGHSLIKISKIEDELVLAIKMDDIGKFQELCKSYIMELAECNQINKLRSFIFNDLFTNTSSMEFEFLAKHQKNRFLILTNILKIIETKNYDNCSELIKEIRTLLATAQRFAE